MNQRTSAARDRWRELIRRQAASGLSVAEFCRRDRVPSSSLFAWKRKLGLSPPAAPAFVEAVVAARSDSAGFRPREAGVIEIRLRGGRRVRIRRGFDRALLVEVVAALEALA
jgi:transposase